jgi:hypothetical protein
LGYWERGPYPGGTTKRYCTYYKVGGLEHQAGNCITVMWGWGGGAGGAGGEDGRGGRRGR